MMFWRQLHLAGAAFSLSVLYAGADPIHNAAQTGTASAIIQLLAQGVSVDARNKSKETPITVAALAGNHAVVRVLIDKGADIFVTNDRGMTPLHAAAFSGSVETIRLLIKAGSKINDKNNFFKISPLHAAAEENQLEAVNGLVDLGANLEVEEKHGYTALTRAGWKENWGIVDTLIKAGAKCQSKDLVGDWWANECKKRT